MTRNPAEKQESVSVSNSELVTVRDAMRGLHKLVEQLQSGECQQFVLLQRGRMVARLVPIEGGRP